MKLVKRPGHTTSVVKTNFGGLFSRVLNSDVQQPQALTGVVDVILGPVQAAPGSDGSGDDPGSRIAASKGVTYDSAATEKILTKHAHHFAIESDRRLCSVAHSSR